MREIAVVNHNYSVLVEAGVCGLDFIQVVILRRGGIAIIKVVTVQIKKIDWCIKIFKKCDGILNGKMDIFIDFAHCLAGFLNGFFRNIN